jgi:hypothetical protein
MRGKKANTWQRHMAIIKVIAGDLRKGEQRIDPKWVKIAELQTEEKLKKLSGSVGWGFAGAVVGGLLTGGIGLVVGGLAGILSGGNKTKVCFSCELEDGRKFLATTDKKTWQKLIAVSFEKGIALPLQVQALDKSAASKSVEEGDDCIDSSQTSGVTGEAQFDELSKPNQVHELEIEEIREYISSALSKFDVIPQVNQANSRLTIVINRKPSQSVDYVETLKYLEEDFANLNGRGFRFKGIEIIELIGRVSGSGKPEWRKALFSSSNEVPVASNEAPEGKSERDVWFEKSKSTAMSALALFWKWYISGFSSRPDKALYESPRFYRILLTIVVIGFVGNLIPSSPKTSISSTGTSLSSLSSPSPSTPLASIPASPEDDQTLTDREFCIALIDEIEEKSSILRGQEAEEYFIRVHKALTAKFNGKEFLYYCTGDITLSEIDRLRSALATLESRF